jgi:DNA polymerase-3 subunit epsilon
MGSDFDFSDCLRFFPIRANHWFIIEDNYGGGLREAMGDYRVDSVDVWLTALFFGMIETTMRSKPAGLDFCAIDFETACYQRASACAVGIVRVRDGAIADTFYTLLKPPKGMGILPSFTAIHGISNADVAKAPDFAEIWPNIRDFIGDDYLVAHNSSFDRSVLKFSLDYYGIEFTVPRFECTVQCSRRKWPELDNHRLDTVSDLLGIELTHHEALSDALACAKIFIAASR